MFQTCPLKLTSMLPKFSQNQEQMRLNIGKILKTASLNSRFTGSKQEECTSTCLLLKNFKTLRPKVTVTYEFTHQQPQGRLLHLKNYSMETVVLILH